MQYGIRHTCAEAKAETVFVHGGPGQRFTESVTAISPTTHNVLLQYFQSLDSVKGTKQGPLKYQRASAKFLKK